MLTRDAGFDLASAAFSSFDFSGGAVVAVSGGSDAREPGYFDAIMREVSERGLQKNFHYLGMIPLPHVYALLRASAALINPSRFEGWSTTVEEAKSFSVPMILSDLDVHREQAAEAASYFGVDDADALANQLAKLADRPAMVHNLAGNVERRVEDFARDFVKAIRSAGGFSSSEPHRWPSFVGCPKPREANVATPKL